MKKEFYGNNDAIDEMIDEISMHGQNAPKKEKLKTLFSLKEIIGLETRNSDNEEINLEYDNERNSSDSLNYGKIDMKMNA